jgi:transposase
MARLIYWQACASNIRGCDTFLLMVATLEKNSRKPLWTRAIGRLRSSSAQTLQKGFVLLPRRWVVERTFAWLNRNRRLAKDVEASIESAVTWLYITSVKLMSRRLASA